MDVPLSVPASTVGMVCSGDVIDTLCVIFVSLHSDSLSLVMRVFLFVSHLRPMVEPPFVLGHRQSRRRLREPSSQYLSA